MARAYSSSRLVTLGLETNISRHDLNGTTGEPDLLNESTYGSLPDEAETTAKPHRRMSYFILFRYSTVCERIMVIFGIIFASVASLGIPFANVIYGEFTSLLIDRSVGVGTSSPTFLLQMFGGGRKLTNASKEENTEAIKEDALAFGIGSITGALGELIFAAIAINILNRVGMNQIGRIRKRFFEAILRQDMSWYDTTSSSNNFASKITEDLDKMKEGISEKVAIFIFLVMTFVTGIGASFFYGWELTLVVCTCCPFIILSTALVAKVQSSLTVKELKAYSGAGTVAEEVFGGIRTVFAFSGERKEKERFAKLLLPAEKTGRKKGLYSGIGAGAMWFLIYLCYAIAMWYGVRLILAERFDEDRRYTPAVLVIVLFGIIMGAQNLGFSTPYIEAFATARGAAQKVFSIIDRKSSIDSMDDKGLKPNAVLGDIDFQDLKFHYPARPDVEVLNGLSLSVKAGQTVSFVGASGCGKSTCLQLLQRFYDPLSGVVKLDGHDRDLNTQWLRAQIGVVGQEPVLFATTIAENIRYGKPSATKEEIEAAARLAHCHDFIVKLPSGYKTLVGERGAQLSGGQKQRIAIARAIVRDPKILLLDEATSALDPNSERKVQDALEVASKGRTTLVVSHRLSTVTNSDKIVFVKNGIVVEEGTHAELMTKGGHYARMVGLSKRTEAYVGGTGEVDDNVKIKMKKADIYEKNVHFEEAEEEGKYKESNENEETDEDEGKEKKKITMRQIMKLNAPEWKYILCGCIAAMLLGATFPAWAVFFGDFFGVLSFGDDDYVRSEANYLSYMFLLLGLVAGLGTLVQTYMFNIAGVKMTSRLRQTAFNTILAQDVTFFDNEKNSTGALCARLAGDCSNIQGATGTRIGIAVQAASTLCVGIIIAFTFSWNLTLVTLITVPFVCLSIFFESKFMESSTMREKAAIERASQVAVEAISNIRTVISLGQERDVLKRYYEQIDRADQACRKKLRFRGVVFGLGQAAPFFAYGISLYYGGILITRDKMPYENIIKVSEALIFGSWMLGQALAYAPNATAAVLSARRLLRLFEKTSNVKVTVQVSDDEESSRKDTKKHDDDIEYEDVYFNYPNRENIPILQDFNLSIKSGTTVALVGPSGSGKSTCVQLLLRYYDPVKGFVKVGGTPTTQFPLDELRSQMGLVSQEPVLFDRTIAENIAYGNNFRAKIPMAEIVEAAKKSNIHDFIMSLPRGYRTSLGNKGAQLSGGQKQRIAIARALLRNPQILILDEATSALDMESEKVVQQALDVARSGRTCVTIAHRLTTVRDADLIYVLKKGVIVEKGTHDELMALGGIYAELYWMQQVA